VNQRKTSARYYLFEELLEQTDEFAPLRRRASLASLQCLAALVWVREGRAGSAPTVKIRRSNKSSHYLYSPGTTGTIHLASKHLNAGALLHEMAHALGHHDKLTHGPAFQKRCLRLYREYGDWSGQVD
jgi:hypothetical protein